MQPGAQSLFHRPSKRQQGRQPVAGLETDRQAPILVLPLPACVAPGKRRTLSVPLTAVVPAPGDLVRDDGIIAGSAVQAARPVVQDSRPL